MKHSALPLFLFFVSSVFSFAGTEFEEDKRTRDPHLGEARGFQSLFVNPAGTAGKTGFETVINAGVQGTLNDFDQEKIILAPTIKLGFLIKGIGLGIYEFNRSQLDFQGNEILGLYNEVGLIAGGGISLLDGKLALGISGNYGFLLRKDTPIDLDDPSSLFTDMVNYGYNASLDLGLLWRPHPRLGVGLVLDDLIGVSQEDLPNEDFFISLFPFRVFPSLYPKDIPYEFSLDIDAGISWTLGEGPVQGKLHLDLYDMLSFITDSAGSGDNVMYHFLDHLRLGAQLTIDTIFNTGIQYYNHYLNVGLGLDLVVIEIYGEMKIKETVFELGFSDAPLGFDLLFRLSL